MKDNLPLSLSYTTSSQYNVYTILVYYTCLCCSSLSCSFFQKNMRKRQPVPLTNPNSKQDRLFTYWRQIPAGTLQASHIWNVKRDKRKWQGMYRKPTASRPRQWFKSNKRKHTICLLLALPAHFYLCQRICVHLCFLFEAEQYLRFLLIDVSEIECQFRPWAEETTKNVPGADPGISSHFHKRHTFLLFFHWASLNHKK